MLLRNSSYANEMLFSTSKKFIFKQTVKYLEVKCVMMCGFMETSKTDQHKEYKAEIHLFCTAWRGCMAVYYTGSSL